MITLISYENSGRTWLSCILKKLNVDFGMNHLGGCLEDISKIEKYLKKYPKKFEEDNIIILTREIKDQIVSNYFQMKYRVGTYSDTLHNFIRNPNFGVEKIIKYNILINNINFYKSKHNVTYESLNKDTFFEISKILKFCEINVEERIIKEVIDYYSFDNMKKRELLKETNEYWYPRTNLTNSESFKTRKGIVGGYKDYLSSEDIMFIENIREKYDYK